MSRGHEVASHSQTHAPLAGRDSATKQQEIHGSREMIERELGVSVAGFRAPNFSIDAEALRLIAQAGYVWDSSSVGGSPSPVTRSPGQAAVPVMPHRPLPDAGLIELPLPAHRPLPFPFHASYSLVLGLRYFEWAITRFRRTAAPFVLLLHLVDFAEPLPRSRLASWAQKLYTLSHLSAVRKGAACRRMLERVRKSYEVMDTARLLEHHAMKGLPS
jgi:peptidoglycan/xylan/chitin deacetylase (PgdA/CDA1 family)